MKFFTSLVTACKDVAGKLRKVSASANGIDVEGRQLVQHFGFVSVPPKGSRIVFLQFGNVTLGIAEDGPDRPEVKEGESALYRNSSNYVIIKADGSVMIKADKGVDIDGELRVSKDVYDNTANPAVTNSMQNMRDILAKQIHSTAVGPSSTGVPPITPKVP